MNITEPEPKDTGLPTRLDQMALTSLTLYAFLVLPILGKTNVKCTISEDGPFLSVEPVESSHCAYTDNAADAVKLLIPDTAKDFSPDTGKVVSIEVRINNCSLYRADLLTGKTWGTWLSYSEPSHLRVFDTVDEIVRDAVKHWLQIADPVKLASDILNK
jgi:hypothetical protein